MSTKNTPKNLYGRTLVIPVFCFILFSLSIFSSDSFSQEKVSGSRQKEIIDTLCSKLVKLYPIPEAGKKTVRDILDYYSKGKYSSSTLLSEFVQQLNNDLESSSKDGHLGIIYDPLAAAELRKENDSVDSGESYADLTSESERWSNYGFKELSILDGNIGYLNLQTFFSLKYAGETAVAAMGFFSNCNGLIIDLRRNGGGWDEMVTFLASYFINNIDDLTLNVMRSTSDNSYSTSKLLAYVPGKRLTNIPLVILTSKSTASAAEAFADIMKHFSKNTSVMGETTAGAENPVSDILLYGDYILRIPTWQKIFSYDMAGWEGAGIKPDIETDSDSSLDIAHSYLLQKLKDGAKNETVKNKYQWCIDGLAALRNSISVPENLMQAYSGRYGNRNIYFENGGLYYQYKGRKKRRMRAISSDYFMVEGSDQFRIKFIKSNNEVSGLNAVYNDGSIINFKKE
ncbi:MAG: S41 family peptidase [Acidobacteriota bacterium]